MNELQEEIIGRHVDLFLQAQAMCIRISAEIRHVFESPFTHASSQNFAVKSAVGVCCVLSIYFEWTVNEQGSALPQQSACAPHHPISDGDRRNLEDVDAKDGVVLMDGGIGPGLGLGEIELDRIKHVAMPLFRRQALDVVEHRLIHIRWLKAQMLEMRREVVDVHAATACELQNVLELRPKMRFQHFQDGITVAVARPSHVRAEWMGIDCWTVARDMGWQGSVLGQECAELV